MLQSLERPPVRSLVRAAIALVILAQLGSDLVAYLEAGGSAVSFFSFFTNDSNLIAAAVLVLAAARPHDRSGRMASLRGAAVLYMTITAIVAQIILLGGLAGFMKHIVAPVAVIADWVLFPPGTPVSKRAPVAWLVFPMAWAVYTAVRGSLTGWYPYFFMNPGAVGGAAPESGYVIVIAALMLLFARVIRLLSMRRPVEDPAAA